MSEFFSLNFNFLLSLDNERKTVLSRNTKSVPLIEQEPKGRWSGRSQLIFTFRKLTEIQGSIESGLF